MPLTHTSFTHQPKGEKTSKVLALMHEFVEMLQGTIELEVQQKRSVPGIKYYLTLIKHHLHFSDYSKALQSILRLHILSSEKEGYPLSDFFINIPPVELIRTRGEAGSFAEDLKTVLMLTESFFLKFKEVYCPRGRPDVVLPAQRASGVQLIHMVWLGRMLEEEELVKIAAANVLVWSRWQLNDLLPCKSIIWTNNKGLLAIGSFRGMIEFKNIDEIIFHADIPPAIKLNIRVHIAWNLLASACDLIRVAAIYLHGGLYRDITWQTPFWKPVDSQEVPTFSAEEQDIRLYARPFRCKVSPGLQPYRHFDQNFLERTLNLSTDLPAQKKLMCWFGDDFIDTNLFYAGCAKHPFFESLLDHLATALSLEASASARVQHAHVLRSLDRSDDAIFEQVLPLPRTGYLLIRFGVIPAAFEYVYEMEALFEISLPATNKLVVFNSPRGFLNVDFGLVKKPGGSWYHYMPGMMQSVEF